ncbi:zinc-finger domain-containing protein [Robertmurraya yapensis]|uniref:Zinc-finger domain-containing protein n=2 Tax=Bacillaceae TaxID=186817 RepID=A0A3S0KGV0_9BACI|nr:zinc-finger domain-containing protein [Bacillus yapensis]RTR30519.1 zinc-finger domain-containing protein [Bacillus yapensis]TKS95338.1 zinc-finger domain-containing protein [Bacillus yapensis]
MNRKQVLMEVEEMLNSYCKGCFLHKYHKKEIGRTYAHKFCISQCTVGQKIKMIGDKLT